MTETGRSRTPDEVPADVVVSHGCSCSYFDCKVHVACDEACQALLEPRTVAELQAALEHWQDHGSLAGCSHAR